MSFTVKLYTFTKAPNSTAQPTGGTDYSCVSNDDFNIINPRIPLQIGASANPSAYNYAYIGSFSRYYWINRWAWEGGLWVAYMTVDALASWKTNIGGLSAYVLRAAGAYNGNIKDGMYPVKTPTSSRTYFGNEPWQSTYLNQKYVIGIVGKGSTRYWVMSGTELTTFYTTVFDDTFFNTVDGGGGTLRKAEFNPIQYVTTIRKFPLGDPGITTSGSIKLGYWDTGLTGSYISNSGRTHVQYTGSITLPKHPQAATRGPFLNNAPYIEYTAFMPPFGRIQLPGQYLDTSTSLSWTLDVDWVSGSGILILKNDNGVIVYQGEATVGMPVQFSQVLCNPTNITSNVIPRIAVAATDIILGTSQGMGAGTFGTMMPEVNTIGTDAGMASIFCEAWSLNTVVLELVDEDLADRGRPLCEKRTLSTLSGYQLCADVDVTIPCTRDEEQLIKGFLESGYFYE